jgi:hypothetical protein
MVSTFDYGDAGCCLQGNVEPKSYLSEVRPRMEARQFIECPSMRRLAVIGSDSCGPSDVKKIRTQILEFDAETFDF